MTMCSLMLTLLAIGSYAQPRNTSVPEILPMAQVVTALQSGSVELLEFIVLTQDVQPSAYMNDGVVKIYGDHPTCFYIGISDVGKLSAEMIPQSTKLITVRIDSAPAGTGIIDLHQFKDLPNLKYVYLLATSPISEEALRELIINDKNTVIQYKVFYNFVKDM